MSHPQHPLLHTYPGASFKTHPFDNGNLNGPHLAQASGGDSFGYWSHVPMELPGPIQWGLPPAMMAQMEGRGTGVYGQLVSGQGQPFNYGWPKYGPVGLSLLILAQGNIQLIYIDAAQT